MRKSSVSLLLVAGVAGLAAPAWAQSQPVEPIVPPAPAVTVPAPVGGRVPAPQVADDEAPHAHRAVDAETFGRSAPPSAEPESSQLAFGLALAAVTVITAVKVGLATGGDRGLWYAGAVLAGGAVGTGAIVCAVGQRSPTRHGGCSASIAGALLGIAGAVPGLLLLKWEASRPCTATGPNADDACATGGAIDGILDLTLAGGGYVLGTAFAARFGWELGATSRFVAAPPAASVSLLSVQF